MAFDNIKIIYSNYTSEMKNMTDDKLTYNKLFWLFIMGNILGVIVEGFFCLIFKGHWESHVVSVIGYFNLLYGAGAVCFYLGVHAMKKKSLLFKVIVMMLAATLMELLCGIALYNILGVRAWNYEDLPLNYKGMICPLFAFAWGMAALIFSLIYPKLTRLLNCFEKKKWKIACVFFSIFMFVNIVITGFAITRWIQRHKGIPPTTKIEKKVDKQYPDDWMAKRFMDWHFIDE